MRSVRGSEKYHSLGHQVYSQASRKVKEFSGAYKSAFAVVIDLDGMVLDYSQNQAQHWQKKLGFTQESKPSSVNQCEAMLVLGAWLFLNGVIWKEHLSCLYAIDW